MRRPRDSAVLRRWLNGTCAVLVLGLVSCGANLAAEPAPTGVPSSPTASAEAQVSSSASQEALNAEAERVYRAFFAEHKSVLAGGGAQTLPPEFENYTMGEYAGLIESVYRKVDQLGIRSKPGTEITLTAQVPFLQESRDDALITIAACIDSSKSPMVSESGEEFAGGINFDVLFLKRDIDGALKIFAGRDEAVKACPIG